MPRLKKDSKSAPYTIAEARVHAGEKHYTPKDLADLWGMSTDTIRRIFENVPGVLKIDRPEQMHKRGYRSLFIPASVAAEVHLHLAA